MKRYVGIDVIKTFAAYFVICVHFFLNTSYYYTNLILCRNLFFQTCLRWTFLICVPLFMISTGFLQSNKQINGKYYKGILNILGIYLFYSLAAILIRSSYFDEKKSVIEWIYDIVGFKANQYSWYINMFIGLFLLTPFLNLIFNNLKNKKQALLLIIILLFLCGLPSFFNYMPITKNATGALWFPDWWIGIYPILYYFIGCYIKKYEPKLNKVIIIISFAAIIVVESTLTFYFSKGGYFSAAIGEYSSILVIASTTLFFLFFYNINITNKKISFGLKKISSITLDIYLGSYIVDKFIYKYVMSKIFVSNFQIIFYFIQIVGIVIAISTCVGLIRKFVTNKISKLINLQAI